MVSKLQSENVSISGDREQVPSAANGTVTPDESTELKKESSVAVLTNNRLNKVNDKPFMFTFKLFELYTLY